MTTGRRPCLYCATPTNRGKKGEHILPEAIGGALTLNDVSDYAVCPPCNNGPLSQIDRELCSRSYLSIVASQEIAAHLWQVWDVDHAAGNLLIEAKPRWVNGLLDSVRYYPQIVFEDSGPTLRADLEDMAALGFESFERVLVRAAKNAFQRHCARVKGALYFERVQPTLIERGYRLPPRVFSSHTITEIAEDINEQTFIVRYTEDRDRKRALRGLASLGDQRFRARKQVMGSPVPTISCHFDVGDTLRALMKIGVNFLAAYCKKTPVNPDTFRQAIRLIRGEVHAPPQLLMSNGFVRAEDIKVIKGEKGAHTFRLVYLDRRWLVYSSFFGGRLGAVVHFPGPNKEEWNTADITAPIGRKDWTVTTSAIIQPLRVRIEWNDSARLCPSLRIHNANSDMRIEVFARKAHRA
jgi:hypothetical protein